MSVTGSVVGEILNLTQARRVFTYPGSPPRYVYEAVEDAGKEIVTGVREQHLLHLAQTDYFRDLEKGEERIPVVVVSADLGEAMLSQPLLAGSVSCPCIIVVAEEKFPHVDNSANIAHQTDRATTHQNVSNNEVIQRHENVGERVLIEGKRDLEKIEHVVETVRENKDVGVIHLPLYAEEGEGAEFEDVGDDPPSLLPVSQFKSRWETTEQPLIIVGRGIRCPETRNRISTIAKTGGIPIATTLQMDGYFETNHIGRIGTVGTPSANEALYQADLVVTLGSSMNNLLTSYDPEAIETFRSKTVQVEENPRRRSVFVDAWLAGEVDDVLKVMERRRADPWFDIEYDTNGKRDSVPEPVEALADSICARRPDSVVTLGVGNAMIWMTYALGPDMRKEVSRSGSMGEVVSGLLWGESPVLVLGDGEFEMDLSLITEAQHQDTAPIICVVNNSRLGLVAERQEAEFGEQITEKVQDPISYEELGNCFDGVESFTATTSAEVKQAFARTVSSDDVSIIEIKVTEQLSDEIFDITELPRVTA